jgi:hypothetical protein
MAGKKVKVVVFATFISLITVVFYFRSSRLNSWSNAEHWHYGEFSNFRNGTPKEYPPYRPTQEIETSPLPISFESVNLGSSEPISIDNKSNLILYWNGKIKPKLFPASAKPGFYYFQQDRTVKYIGETPAVLSSNGDLVTSEMDAGLMFDRAPAYIYCLSHNGKAIKNLTFETLGLGGYTGQSVKLLTISASSLVYKTFDNLKIVRLNGSEERVIPESQDFDENAAIKFLRWIGVLNEAHEYLQPGNLFLTSQNELFANLNSEQHLFNHEETYLPSTRFAEWQGDKFVTPELLKNKKFEFNMRRTPNGTIGLNEINRFNVYTQASIFDHGTYFELPLPKGHFTNFIQDVADNKDAIVFATRLMKRKENEPELGTTLLWHQGKYYDINKALLTVNNNLGVTLYKKFYLYTTDIKLQTQEWQVRTNRFLIPEVYDYFPAMLPNGDLLTLLNGDQRELVLLHRKP